MYPEGVRRRRWSKQEDIKGSATLRTSSEKKELHLLASFASPILGYERKALQLRRISDPRFTKGVLYFESFKGNMKYNKPTFIFFVSTSVHSVRN